MNENRDFLQSNYVWINFFVTCGSPLFSSIFIVSLDDYPYNRLLITLDMLSLEQQTMVKVVLVLALFKALACLLLIFNPFEYKRYKMKYECFKKASSVTFYSSMIVQIALPILSYIYCGALWSSN